MRILVNQLISKQSAKRYGHAPQKEITGIFVVILMGYMVFCKIGQKE